MYCLVGYSSWWTISYDILPLRPFCHMDPEAIWHSPLNTTRRNTVSTRSIFRMKCKTIVFQARLSDGLYRMTYCLQYEHLSATWILKVYGILLWSMLEEILLVQGIKWKTVGIAFYMPLQDAILKHMWFQVIVDRELIHILHHQNYST